MKKLNKKVVIIGGILVVLLCVELVLWNPFAKKGEDKTEDKNDVVTKQDFNDSDSGINVAFNSAVAGTKLKIEKVNSEVGIENVVAVYEIDLVNADGEIVKVDNNKAKVSINYDNSANYDEFEVLYLNSDTNEIIERIPAVYENGKVVFEVTHFSRYAIVGKKAVVEDVEKKEEKTVSSEKAKTVQKEEKKEPAAKEEEKTPEVVTYTYKWAGNPDLTGKDTIYIINNKGETVSGSLVVTTVSGMSTTYNVPASGYFLPIPSSLIASISDVKGN